MLTTRDVAQRLGVTRRRVLAMIQRGRLPARRLGWQWVIEEAALDAVRVRRPGRPRTASPPPQ
jgi:excisionase family DNA binding protein